ERNGLADPDRIQVGQGLWVDVPGFRGQPRVRRVNLPTVVARARDSGRQLKWQDNSTRGVEWMLAKSGFLDGDQVNGLWNQATTKAYSAWQKAYSDEFDLGWSGDDLDGIPGETSLKALADRHDYGMSA